jgi:N-acetylneuraminic acid mutarotase
MKSILRFSILVMLSCILLYSGTAQAFIWTQKANFTPGNRYGAFSFAIGDYGYIGSGVVQTGSSYNLVNDFWAYNSITDSWSQKASLPAAGRIGAATFSVLNRGFVATGNDYVSYLNDLWEYEPTMNSWTQKASFPGGPRYTCSAFAINEYGFVGMGRLTSCYSDFYRYDVLQDIWTPIAAVPGPARQSAKGFTVDGFGYVVGGAEPSQQYNSNQTYRYDPIGDNWVQVANYPGNGSHGFAGFVLNDVAYIGTGTSLSSNNQVYDDLWSYEPALDLWSPVPNFTGGIRQGTASMAIGNKGYLGLGSDVIFPALNYKSDWWSFIDPTGIDEPVINDVNVFVDTDNNLHIDLPTAAKNAHVFNLYNAAGQLVAKKELVANENKLLISLSEYAKGVYTYSLSGVKNQWSGKISLLN